MLLEKQSGSREQVGDLPRTTGPDDNIVTTFCESVTPRRELHISRTPASVTTEMGEAMASASGFVTGSGVGAAPIFLIALMALVLAACGDDQPRGSSRPATAAHGSNAADPAAGVTTDLDGPAPAFGDGVLAELTGDETAARASYERVLGSQDAPSDVAARAALHLAQLEARAGKTGRARDLIARAAALAPADPTITEGADRVRAEIVARSSAGDIRGPKIGTQLVGVTPEVANLFAQAEQALARVHAMRPRQRLAVWEKEDATADVVRRYRAVAEKGGVAQIAAEYRIGTLFHDLALSLLFEPPADLRRTLRAGAFAYLKKATTAYKASLATPAPTENEQLWHLAAETDLRAALDVLGEASPK